METILNNIMVILDFLIEMLSKESVFASIVGAFVGASAGSVGAFIAAQYLFHVTRRHEKWFEHRDALIGLIILLNEYLEIITKHRIQAEVMRKALQPVGKKQAMFWGSFEMYPIDRFLIKSLVNNKAVNDAFRLRLKLKRMNHDLLTIQSSYTIARQARIEEHFGDDQFQKMSVELGDYLKVVKCGCDQLHELVILLLALVRILEFRDKVMPIWRFVLRPKSAEVSDEEVNRERKKLEREIEQTQQRGENDKRRFLGDN